MNARVQFAVSAASLVAFAGLARAQSFSEGFEGGAIPAGWSISNQSSPIGTTTWGAGTTTLNGDVLYGPHSGSFLAFTDYECASGAATISNWLILPQVTLRNGDTFSFWTRSTDGVFADRMQVLMSTSGASTNTGSSATDVGDFTTVLLDINPGYTATDYPLSFQSFTITVSGLGAPTSGRFAFRYFVENGGPAGSASDCIGIDDVAYVSAADAHGACCLGDGSCISTISVVCSGQGGAYHGDGSSCASTNCPAGACCKPDGSCVTRTSAACAALSGIYRGDGSSCATANCPVPPYQNGGFETGDFTGWTQFGDSAYTAVADSSFGTAPEEGTFCAHFGAVGDTGGISQVIAAHAGDHVTIDFWYQAQGGTNNSFSADFDGQNLVNFSDDATNTVWTEFNFQRTVSADNPTLSFTFENDPSYDYLDNVTVAVGAGVSCYANCDHSTGTPFLNVADFTCFLQKFSTGNAYANCDNSTTVPVLNVQDFTCFLQKFALGCSAP
jgi:Cleaved Adhesin Domain